MPLAVRTDAVGPEPMSTAVLVTILRNWLCVSGAIRVTMPRWVMAGAVRLGISPVAREGMAVLAV
ncbi:hypothetical protein [Sphingomonas endophytica]|uniref:Uncharacterized protein n=1 Tax=Sphingomonas endophytica TaxID=869719 RepID=A0A147IA84_9SPHN|nr:hypothetical protein [Sphingomonas endophytica]KTT76674.1 hypothetical protein NS334_00155 [Sphingomonas endophytica]